MCSALKIYMLFCDMYMLPNLCGFNGSHHSEAPYYLYMLTGAL